MGVKGKKVLVVGAGVTGMAVARYCATQHAAVTINDARPERDMTAAAGALEDFSVRMLWGGHPADIFRSQDLIVVSPGVPHDLPALTEARSAGVEVIGEIELAYRELAARGFGWNPHVSSDQGIQITAITGTNGKSTVTELIGDILEADRRDPFIGGNIGTPFIDILDRTPLPQTAVLEVSSFQLETIEEFHPFISIILNVTPDHLDRYPEMAAYVAAKRRVLEVQTHRDVAVLCGADTYCREMAHHTAARVVFFYPEPPREHPAHAWATAYADDMSVVFEERGAPPRRVDARAWKLAGGHNRLNLVASVAGALISGVPEDTIAAVIGSFEPLAHRCTLVGELNGVRYYDDSKGTNVGAVLAAVSGFDESVVLLLGGRDKDGDFTVLGNALSDGVRAAIVFGEARTKIAQQLEHTGRVHHAETMRDALARARDIAEPGEVVLLSPGCASFDEFANYAERGNVFTDTVRAWMRESGDGERAHG